MKVKVASLISKADFWILNCDFRNLFLSNRNLLDINVSDTLKNPSFARRPH
jgi:hypothetical protein